MSTLFPYRFIHCSDVHLGTGRQIHPDRYLDFFNVFDEVLQAAIDERVDALMIAGDLFDTKEPDVETLARTIALLKRLKDEHPKIAVLAIEGNHDVRKRAVGVYRNQQGALDVLASAGLLQVLRPEREGGDSLDLEAATYHAPHHDISVVGLGYKREHPEERFNEAIPYIEQKLAKRQVILLQHMMLSHEGMLYHGATHPSTLDKPPAHLIYVGLGHGHSRIHTDHAYHQELFCAPGALEFVHVRNVGKNPATRGYFVVEVNGRKPTIEHRSTQRKRTFVRKSLVLDPSVDTSFDALRARILEIFEASIPEVTDRPICSLQLSGRLGFSAADFRSTVIQRDLRERFGALQILVDRQEVQTLEGERIELEVTDDYTDALHSALEELLEAHGTELGGETSAPLILARLKEAIADPKASDEALRSIEDHLKTHRTRAPVAERELDITGMGTDEMGHAIDSLCASNADTKGLRITLVGTAPLDADGLPQSLDLTTIQDKLGEDVLLVPSAALYTSAASHTGSDA